MFNTDPLPPLSTLSTEMTQKYLEENKELIMATMDGQNQGKFAEVSQCLAKLQHNLTYLAKLADAAPQPQPQLQSLPQLQLQPQMHSQEQGQGIMQHPHVATMSQKQQNLSTLNLHLDMNDNHLQQQQYHKAMSEQQQQHDLSTSKLGFQINEQQQQQHKIPTFFQQQQQHQLMFAGSSNSGYYQAQTKLTNLLDMPEINHVAPSDLSPVWSLTKSPSESTVRNTRS